MTFLTILRVTEILCSFTLVLEGKTGKEIPESSKLEFLEDLVNLEVFSNFVFLIGIHSMQGWTATTRLGVTRKEAQTGLQDTEYLFRQNLQLKDVC